MPKYKVYGTKKNVTVDVCNLKEARKEAKKKGSGNILQIDSLDPCI